MVKSQKEIQSAELKQHSRMYEEDTTTCARTAPAQTQILTSSKF